MPFPRVPLHAAMPLALALLTACGGGGASAPAPAPAPPPVQPAPTPPATHDVSVAGAAGARQQRLACNGVMAQPACALRIYQVMVESFVDRDPLADFNVGYGTSAHKGDLAGITASLDYIKSTGVNALWLTPIFLSAARPGQDVFADRLDATGYFASDYFKIDPRFGTLEQARTLVDEAHKRGLYVFFDGVFGHHKGGVAPSPGGLLPAGGSNPVDYSAPATLAFYREVATYWIEQLKIDGWRLDQAYQVPAAAWGSIRGAVEQASSATSYLDAGGVAVRPLGYMVAEVWQGESQIAAAAYGGANAPALLSAFDFPLRYRLLQTLAAEESGAAGRPASNLAAGFDTHAAYPDHAMPNLMLGNHDLVRFGDLVQRAGLGDPDGADYWLRHKAAFAFMAAYSGPITLYYGDEIGQEVPNYAARVQNDCANLGLCDDHVSRDNGVVDGVAGPALSASARDLKNHVAALLRIRAANPALAKGARTHVFSDSNVYIDRKDSGANRVLLVLNVKKQAARVTLEAAVVDGAAGLTDLVNEAALAPEAGGARFVVTVPPLSARLLRF
ncbi:alpha-amylase family protein [Massilia glaciei]|nr:alpha-amylase family protein [Massilia glaciei]